MKVPNFSRIDPKLQGPGVRAWGTSGYAVSSKASLISL